MVKEMLLGVLHALVAALFVTLNAAAPQLRALTFDTDESDTCLEYNRHFINHVSIMVNSMEFRTYRKCLINFLNLNALLSECSRTIAKITLHEMSKKEATLTLLYSIKTIGFLGMYISGTARTLLT
jgi:hypothetical protein